MNFIFPADPLPTPKVSENGEIEILDGWVNRDPEQYESANIKHDA
jgi:hypothetical protein